MKENGDPILGKDPASRFGDFTLFGFSQNPDRGLENKLLSLGITPQTVDFGPAGILYFYTNFGDVVETDDLIGLKLGFARTPDMTPMSTSDLLTQRLLNPRNINQDGLRGNALIACFSKKAPEFSVFQTIMATPQLYYSTPGHDILCSNSLNCLITLLDQLELNEDIIPFYFLFQLVPGSFTFFRHVSRMFPGQRLHWREKHLTVDHVKDLRFSNNAAQFDRIDPYTVGFLYERIKAVISAYFDDVASTGGDIANLLSGGVDSSVVQLAINDRQSASAQPRTYGYTVHVPGFDFEADYTHEASQLLGTNHASTDIWPDDFPDLLVRATEAIAQPIPSEPDACKMALAEFLASKQDTPRFYFVGQGADAVYGLAFTRKLAAFNLFRRIPASEQVLKALATLIQPAVPSKAHGLLEVAQTLAAMDDPYAFGHWLNRICVQSNLEAARRSFGDETLQKALAYRRHMEQQYLNSSILSEQLHMIDLLTAGYEPAVLGSQMFLTQRKEQIYPYLDEDIIRIAFAFESRVRFIKPGLSFVSYHSTKPLLKEILIQRSYASIAKKRKGASVFFDDVCVMMKSGSLRDRVRAIDRPGFLNKSDFDALLEKPDYFLWSLLTFDVFQKRVLA